MLELNKKCGRIRKFGLKTILKLFVSIKHNNILLFILILWRQVSVVRPLSGHLYKKF